MADLADGLYPRAPTRGVGGPRLTGTDKLGRPTQISRTVHGGKREAQRVASEMEAGTSRSERRGRAVADVLDAWVEQNQATWAASTKRDQTSRAERIKNDPIGRLPIARLSVGDVESWHTRLRADCHGDAGLRNLHTVLRAAIAQAVRWGWVSTNVAARARLRSAKTAPRGAMELEDVLAVLAALQWTDVRDAHLTIDSSIEVVSRANGVPELRDASTKTANRGLG